MHLCTAARSKSNRFRPALERLEHRDCPAAPQVVSIGWETAQQAFTLSGAVTDEHPAGLTVHFTGVYSGSARTDAAGHFSVQVQPTELGVVWATVTDDEGLSSQAQQANLSSSAPQITGFTAQRLILNTWTFSGHVADEFAPGLKVRLGGLPALANKTVFADVNGNFSLTVELAQGEQGTAWAETTDWWGQNSNLATYTVMPSV